MNVPFVDLSRIHKPLKKDFDKAFQNVVDSNGFVLGKEVEQFEKEFTAYEGAKFGTGVANGTDGILLALKACGIKPGDEVITQAHTFIASALGITYAGATPVFADIDEDSLTLDVASAEKMITKRTRALLPVCLYGQPANISGLSKLAKKYKLRLILDNAQAHGATYQKKSLGTFADACSYSFYPGKNLGAFGDGGFVTTNTSSVEKQVKLLRNIGRTGWYQHPVKGYNSRLDTIQAAILSIKLKHLDEWTKKRRTIASQYAKLLKDLPVIVPKELPDRMHVYHLYVIRTKKREQFMTYLEKEGVHTSIHYPIPVHKQIAYKELPKKKLPVSEQVADEVVSLPFFVGITQEEQEYVAEKIKKFFK